MLNSIFNLSIRLNILNVDNLIWIFLYVDLVDSLGQSTAICIESIQTLTITNIASKAYRHCNFFKSKQKHIFHNNGHQKKKGVLCCTFVYKQSWNS